MENGSKDLTDLHATHRPDFDRTEAEMICGQLRDLTKKHTESPA